jgi:hypothetical protein
MMRRREFLSASLAAAAPEDRIRIGFLGSSHSHAEAKIRIVKESPRWELAGVSNDDGPTREALRGDPSIAVSDPKWMDARSLLPKRHSSSCMFFATPLIS